MRTDGRFREFSRRVTRVYVILAIILIATVAGASSVLAFFNYARTLNDAVDNTAGRVSQRVEYYQAQHQTLAQYASSLAQDESHSRVHVSIFGAKREFLAGAPVEQTGSFGRELAEMLNVHRRVIHVPGGTIVLQPDFAAFDRWVLRYWSIIIPVGIVCVLIAWVAGRAITRRAVAPLIDVTDALRGIAEGDFTPKLLLEHGTGLHDLTAAYNDVAYRLNVATAEQRRQSAEMRQFIADAGHELRTPLTIFMGYLDALRQGVVRDSEAVQRVHETMLDESRKMRTIIEKLILLARLERESEPRRDRIDLNSVAARAIDALRPLGGERLHLAINGGASIVGEDAELYEAVKNVVENAVRYAPDSPIEVHVQSSDGFAELSVSDRGPGMQTVDVEHAFDRFYRGMSRANVEGSGLGLAIAKRAVERVGGTIELQSKPSQGTRVTMRFPLG